MNYSLSAEWGNITSGIDAPFALPQVDITLLSQSVQLCLEQSISNRSSNVRLTPNGILIPPFQAGSENLPEAPLSLRIAGTYYSIQEGTTELCPTLTINGEEQAVKIKVINDNGQLSMHLLESVTFTSTVSIPADGFSKDGTGSSPGYYLSCVSPSNIVCYNGNCDDVCHDLSNEEACTGGEMIMLNAFLTSYDAFVTSVSLDDLSYPLRLNTVQFCNGVQRILLDDNLNILGNVAYKIISQQWVADKENAIILLDGGQISTGNIEDLFDAIPGNDDLSIMVEDESPGSPAAYDPIDPITGQDPDNPLMEVTTPISYYLHDHLGNTRMIIRADDPSAMTITYAADYYPYGKILREWSPCEPERFLTTQHERDSESGYDNRGARLYDADVGRFLSVDPLAEDYAAYSGYNYVLGNPIIMIDPDGRSAKWIPSIDDNGVITYTSEEGDSYDTFVEQYGEEAAREVYSKNCGDCFDSNEVHGAGDISLSSDRPLALIIQNGDHEAGSFGHFAEGQLTGGGEVANMTDVLYQIGFMTDYNNQTGATSFDLNTFFTGLGSSNHGTVNVNDKSTRLVVSVFSGRDVSALETEPIEIIVSTRGNNGTNNIAQYHPYSGSTIPYLEINLHNYDIRKWTMASHRD